MSIAGRTSTTRAMGQGSTQHQHLVQTEVPAKLLEEIAGLEKAGVRTLALWTRGEVTNVVLAAGESIRLETPGGGGFGPPSERALEALSLDHFLLQTVVVDGQSSLLGNASQDFNPLRTQITNCSAAGDILRLLYQEHTLNLAFDRQWE